LVNRSRRAQGAPLYNRKRIRRVMRLNRLTLPGKIRRRDRPHTGQVRMPDSNQRWCSDGFNIRCWNGERVQVAFALDCHDREAIEFVAQPHDLTGHDIRLLLDKALWSRFGERVLKTPIVIEWLSDNGGPYTSFETVSYAHELGFKPITTPAYSPESNGMAEAFVNTMKRDYVGGADLSDAETVLRQLPGWIDDYTSLDLRLQVSRKSGVRPELDGDVPVEPGVERLPDHPHPTLADLLDQGVVGQSLAWIDAHAMFPGLLGRRPSADSTQIGERAGNEPRVGREKSAAQSANLSEEFLV
jgi:putative transposase